MSAIAPMDVENKDFVYPLFYPSFPNSGLACYVCNGTNGCREQGFHLPLFYPSFPNSGLVATSAMAPMDVENKDFIYPLFYPSFPNSGLACYVCNGTNGCSDQGFNKYAGKKEFGCSACYKTICKYLIPPIYGIQIHM